LTFYDAILNNHGLNVDPLKAVVVPRPIGWISTVSKAGIRNLAPYSFFNLFSNDPSYVAFGSGGQKHSHANVEETGVFAFNMATFALREAKNVSSASVAADVDEFALAGLTAVHVDDRFIENGRVNTAALQPIARLGYSEYTTVEAVWRMRRPD
jgi:flavin reductase (DIM6/NTAB) family NADH-FMN oxidoreductase RutF